MSLHIDKGVRLWPGEACGSRSYALVHCDGQRTPPSTVRALVRSDDVIVNTHWGYQGDHA